MASEIMPRGLNASRGQRRALIEDTIKALEQLQPGSLREFADYLEKITKVQVSRWRSGQGHLKAQLPLVLFLSLRAVFSRFLPGEPTFGEREEDLELLAAVAPKLMPPIGGSRARRGRSRLGR